MRRAHAFLLITVYVESFNQTLRPIGHMEALWRRRSKDREPFKYPAKIGHTLNRAEDSRDNNALTLLWF